MTKRVDLVQLGAGPPKRTAAQGETWTLASPDPQSLSSLAAQIFAAGGGQAPAAVLFWDPLLEEPDPETLQQLLRTPCDLWHAGLRLGTGGQPKIIDFVSPTWMLNRDPDPDIEATSWRISLRACLVRSRVITQFGFIRSTFETLEAAALEWGHRCITKGVLTRHYPDLLSHKERQPPVRLPFEDQLRFSYYRFGKKWSAWALVRALLTGEIGFLAGLRAWRSLAGDAHVDESPPFRWRKPPLSHPADVRPITNTSPAGPRVSVLIPTLDRYPYLETLLTQLGHQSIPPCEIIVVDQTPEGLRRPGVYAKFGHLPVNVIYQDVAGQCTARNEGLLKAQGDYVLFIDDDDEISDDLIHLHLASLKAFSNNVSCGVADEMGAGELPENFTYLRASDVFPTNNSLVRMSVLRKSGLFDLAYEHGPRADGDLGTRVYLSGELMILDPSISVIHHHAPRGGLRRHRARVVTYASSRQRLSHRSLPSVTELYLARRFFSRRQVREKKWLAVLGTFSISGSMVRKIGKVIWSALLLPDTLWKIHARSQQAREMFELFPVIPVLPLSKDEQRN